MYTVLQITITLISCREQFPHFSASLAMCNFFAHFQEMSIELSLEDVKKIAFQYGFELEVTVIGFLSSVL